MDLFILAAAWSHVLLTPYTKVEESFNLHATHDVLMYGLRPSNLVKYDHFVFPGAVPRSFLGSIILAYVSFPAMYMFKSFGYIASKSDLQIIVRLVLATVNALSVCILRRAVRRRFGFSTGAFFAILSGSQFHLPFWMGRTLPNMFALFPVNLAFASLFSLKADSSRPAPENVRRAITLLTFTAIIFRAEVCILLAFLILYALFARWVSFGQVIKTWLKASIVSMLLTTLVDSYLWKTYPNPLWPELYSIYFNVYQNKSAEWGVSPFHTYFTSYLPKLLLTSFPLSILGFVVDSRVRGMLLGAGAFVTTMSFLGHKEWRFIVYIIPIFNIVAARGCYWLIRQRPRILVCRIGFLLVLGCFVTNCITTAVMTQVSIANYPGGEALSRFNELYYSETQDVHVHMCNLAAQTGATLFLQIYSPPYTSFVPTPSSPRPFSAKFPLIGSGRHVYNGSRGYTKPVFPPRGRRDPARAWVYNKTENLTPSEITLSKHFTHAIVEAEQVEEFLSSSSDLSSGLGWKTVECIAGFDGFSFQRGIIAKESEGRESERGLRDKIWDKIALFSIRQSDKLCILSRR